jgi:DNA invertase Pin-like site-specific DNA recombinase
MRVFAYLRVSTQEQVDKNGLERQWDAIQSLLASKLDWTIARKFSEHQSGGVTFENRGMLLEMLELAQTYDVEAIVVERADRIARDLMAQEIFFVKCGERNIKVFAADTGQELTCKDGDPTRVLLRQLLGALAQWEKAVIVKKLQDGRRRTAAKTGMPCGGPKGYGTRGDASEQADERRVLNYIRERRRGANWTYKEIADELNRRRERAPGGKFYWHTSTVMHLDKKQIPDTSSGTWRPH